MGDFLSEMMEAWNEFCKAHKVLGDSPEFEVLRTGSCWGHCMMPSKMRGKK